MFTILLQITIFLTIKALGILRPETFSGLVTVSLQMIIISSTVNALCILRSKTSSYGLPNYHGIIHTRTIISCLPDPLLCRSCPCINGLVTFVHSIFAFSSAKVFVSTCLISGSDIALFTAATNLSKKSVKASSEPCIVL